MPLGPQKPSNRAAFTGYTATTATSNVTLTNLSNKYQKITCSGGARTVTLPAYASSVGQEFVIANTSATALDITVNDAAAVLVCTISQNETAILCSDGSTWFATVSPSGGSSLDYASLSATQTFTGVNTFANASLKLGVTTASTPTTVTAQTPASGAGNNLSIVGSPAFATSNAAGGNLSNTAGAGDGTGAGGIAAQTGGASGSGATGNGGASKIVGGAAASTNGSGGAAQVTGGVATGTGTGGAVNLAGGASAGASGTAGGVTIDAGAATGGTAGTVTIGTTNASLVNLGRVCWTPATLQDISTGNTITLPTTSSTKRLGATAGAATGVILTAGTAALDGMELTLINTNATNSITFAAAGTSNVADGTSSVIAALTAMTLVWDNTSSRWYHQK